MRKQGLVLSFRIQKKCVKYLSAVLSFREGVCIITLDLPFATEYPVWPVNVLQTFSWQCRMLQGYPCKQMYEL